MIKKIKLLINEKEKIMVVFFCYANGEQNKKIIKCHKEDKFDWKIGLGVAFSKEIEFSDNYKIFFKKELSYLRKKLSPEDYYNFVFDLVFDFDQNYIEQIENIVNENMQKFEERKIQEKIRKAECKIRNKDYKARKIKPIFFDICF